MKYNKVRMIAKAGNGLRIPKFLNSGSINLLDNPYKGALGGYMTTTPLEFFNPNPNNSGSTSPINTNALLNNTISNSNQMLNTFNKPGNKLKSLISSDQFKSIGMGVANMGLDMLGGLFNDSINSSGVDTMFAVGDTAAGIVGSINPVAGLAVKGVNTLLKGINSLGGKKSEAFSADKDTIESVGGSYGGSVNAINSAAAKAGKKYGMFSSRKRRRANREIREARRLQNIMTNIADEAADLRGMISDVNYLRYDSNINGGYDLANIRAAKSGMKILDKINLIKKRNLNSSYINVDTKSIEEFKEGGSILPEWMPIIEDSWEPIIEEFKEGGSLQSKWKPVIELKEGDKIRTLEELIEYAKKENPRFILRLSEPPRGIEFIDDEGNKGVGNVYLEWSSDDKGNAVIYPRILEMDDKSLKFLSSDEAWKRANENNNILVMSPEEAQIFFAEDPEYQTAYKRGWPEMFKNYSKKVESPTKEFKEGGSLKSEWKPIIELKEEYPQEYIDFKNSLPDNLKNTPETEYDTYRYWLLWGKPKNFEYTLTHPNEDGLYMYNWNASDNSYHGNSIAWGKDRIGYFIKPKHHPTLKYELDWFNKGIVTEEDGKQRKMTPKEHKEWEDFKKNYTLEEEDNFYRYVPIKQSESFKVGGSIKNSLETSEIEETTQKNVIPEGALHKNKHHMEHTEGLTQKGIPVVDNEGNLQAEIELNEIVFNLEVTKFMEERYRKYFNSETIQKEKDLLAIEVGELLVDQILNNTDDRTNLIETVEV